jgi:hypothetical protein
VAISDRVVDDIFADNFATLRQVYGTKERTYPAKRGPVDDLMDGSEMAYDEAMRGALGGLGKDFQRSLRSELGKVSRSEEKMVAVAAEIAQGVVARTEAVEASVKASGDAQAEAIREAARQNAETTARAIASAAATTRAAQAQTAAVNAELVAALKVMAKPRKRRVVRGEDGRIVETVEE